ncbi:MAG: hypothetical protein WCI77_06955 [Candidatus Omnitrophota bacterium]
MKKTFIFLTFIFIAHLSFAYEDSYYSTLYEKASQAIQKGNEEDADFYLARYMGTSFLDKESKKDITDLSPLFNSYKVSKPTAFISGRYSADFIDWFIQSSIAQWGGDDDEDIDPKTHSFGIVSSESNVYFATVIGSPYLEGWSIIKDKDMKKTVLVLIDYRQKPYLVVGKHEKGIPKKLLEKKEFDLDEFHLQYVWPPEFHDLDKDGKDELWVRYNKAWADGFSQELVIYKIKDNGLELIKKFEGEAEGIARRLDGNKVEVGRGFTDKNAGHLEFDQHHLETWEYKNGNFVKTSERNVPHLLWSDEWKKYYFNK